MRGILEGGTTTTVNTLHSMLHTLAMLVAIASTAAAANPPAASGAERDADIRRMLVTRVDVQKHGTGAVVGIIDQDGKRIISHGTLSVDDDTPVDGDTVFDIGSITKVFTALLLSDMAQRGEVALGDPWTDHVPAERTRLRAPGTGRITLTDLATHTSGLPLRPDNLVSKDPDNKYAGYTPDALYQYLSDFSPPRDPGSAYEYSNVGYGLLGHILSERSGQDYRKLVRSRITRPLRMSDTRIDPSTRMRRRAATGYGDGLRPLPHWDLGALESAGAFRSTANDLLRFLETALGLRRSKLAPAMSAMLDTRRPGGMPPSEQIALGWNIHKTADGEIAWKNGSVGGYRSFIGYDPKRRLGVVALTNGMSFAGVDDIGLHLLDPALPVDLRTPKVRKEVAVDPAILDRYVGTYQFSPTDIIMITREGDRLVMQQPGQDKIPLFAESERDFFLKIADAQITFESSDEGPATAAVWHQVGPAQRAARIEPGTGP